MVFKIEDIVYLKTDTEILPRMIVKYEVSKTSIMYNLACGSNNSWHFDFEFTKDKSELTQKIGFQNANQERGQ